MGRGQSRTGSLNGDFKGNKSYLPSKPCTVCKKEMTWRKSWAKNW
ncbi:MAG TPA: DUF2256 domain-containing protein, partial [Limnobacter sp.]|nr:DUF2256 domain-containing protein [Limnobacter sp.]